MNSTSLRSIFLAIRELVYPFISLFITKAMLVEGQLRNDDEIIRILFVHNCRFNWYIQDRTFDSNRMQVIFTRRLWIPFVNRFLRKYIGCVDLIIAVLPEKINIDERNITLLRGQQEVRQVIRTRGGWNEIREKFSKKRRQISNGFQEKSGLNFRISNSVADFNLFYYKMHMPLVQSKFGDRKELDSYQSLLFLFRKGFLLLVERDGQPVAGALSQIESNKVLFRRSGVLNGDESLIKGGVQTALYFFQLQFAVAGGYDALDSLKSLPILNDGVFRHKADWGAVSCHDNESTMSVNYIFDKHSSALLKYFKINPTILNKGDELFAVVSSLDDNRDAQGIREIKYGLAGLSRVIEINDDRIEEIYRSNNSNK